MRAVVKGLFFLIGFILALPLFYVLAAEAVSNAGLSLILVRSLGIHGVALGTAIPASGELMMT